MTQLCNHELIPIVYGYMTNNIIKQIEKNEIVYGGYSKTLDSAQHFCIKCLEDIDFL